MMMAKFEVGDRVRVPEEAGLEDRSFIGAIGTIITAGALIRRPGSPPPTPQNPNAYANRLYEVKFDGRDGVDDVMESDLALT